MRETKYFHGYGYITTGNGIFDNVINFLTRKEVADVMKEGLKAAGKSAATTIGERAGKKIADKIIRPKPSIRPKSEIKPTKKKEEDVLKQIYGDGLKRGKGLKRI